MTTEAALSPPQQKSPGCEPGQQTESTPLLYTQSAADARVANVRDGHNRGWSFTPLVGKKPVDIGWSTAPRESLETARAWAASGNIGLRTGAASGVIVLDLDADKNTRALAGLPDGFTGETVTAITGKGGMHLYYAAPPGVVVKNSASKIAANVDVRGDGGQVVYPGSIHPDNGEPYRWAADRAPEDMPLAPWPVELHERLTRKERDTRPSAATTLPPISCSDKYLETALQGELAVIAAAPEGTRNATLNRVAHKLSGYTWPYPEYPKTRLLTAALIAGLPEAEARKTIESGWKSGAAKPRTVAARPAPRALAWDDTVWHTGVDTPEVSPGDDATSTAPTTDLPWYNLGENWDTKAIPPTDFVLGYAVPAGVVTSLVAPPGVGKSWFGATLGVSVATGANLIPGMAPPRSGHVVLATLEEDGIEVHRRLQKIARAFNLTENKCEQLREYLSILPACLLRALSRGPDRAILPGPDLMAIRNHLQVNRTRLFVLDTLSAVMGGVAKENDADDMAPVMACLRSVLPRDCALLLICHTGKNTLDATARGSSAQEGAVRSRLTLRLATPEETKGLPEDTGTILVLGHGKSNLGEEGKPIYLQRLTGPELGGVLIPFDAAGTIAARRAAEDAQLRHSVITVLSSEDVTKTQLMGHSRHKVAREHGSIVRDKIADLCDGRAVTIKELTAMIDELEEAAHLFVEVKTQFVKPTHLATPWCEKHENQD